MNRLTRSVTDRRIAGVCGGLGKYLKVDPTVVRILAVILLFVSFGMAFFGYLIGVFLMPNETDVN